MLSLYNPPLPKKMVTGSFTHNSGLAHKNFNNIHKITQKSSKTSNKVYTMLLAQGQILQKQAFLVPDWLCQAHKVLSNGKILSAAIFSGQQESVSVPPPMRAILSKILLCFILPFYRHLKPFCHILLFLALLLAFSDEL